MNELRMGLTDGKIVSKEYLAIKDAEIYRLRAENAELGKAIREYACTGTDEPCGCHLFFTQEKAEIDRLRAEFEEYRKVKKGQIDYLRSENELLRQSKTEQPLLEPWIEIARMRYQNSELEDALRMVVSSGYDEASRLFAAEVATRAILAKTTKKED